MCPILLDEVFASTGASSNNLNPDAQEFLLSRPLPSKLQIFCQRLKTRFAEFGNFLSSDIPSYPRPSSLTVNMDSEHNMYVSNDPLNLAISTIDHMRRGVDLSQPPIERQMMTSSPLQYEGDAAFTTWLEIHRNLAYDMNDKRWSSQEMLKLIGALSKMFFLDDFQVPANHVEVRFRWVPGLLRGKSAYGITTHRVDVPEPRIDIVMDPLDYSRDVGHNYTGYVCSILLHELIHAYLMSYCCDGYHDTSEKCTRNGRTLWAKGNGHCIGWFHLACNFEHWLEYIYHDNQAYRQRPNLSVMGSYLYGLRNGETLLLAQEWRRFFSSWDHAAKLFEHLSARESAEFGGFLDRDSRVMQVWIEAEEEFARATGQRTG